MSNIIQLLIQSCVQDLFNYSRREICSLVLFQQQWLITSDSKCSSLTTANSRFRNGFLLTFQFIQDHVKIPSIPIGETSQISLQKIRSLQVFGWQKWSENDFSALSNFEANHWASLTTCNPHDVLEPISLLYNNKRQYPVYCNIHRFSILVLYPSSSRRNWSVTWTSTIKVNVIESCP